MTTIDAVNAMDEAEFVAAFGDVAESSPWVAARAYAAHPYADRDDVVRAFTEALHNADEQARLGLLRAHPDLAGRAARSGDIGSESAAEQKGAGLDTLTPPEYEKFHRLNGRYRERFGFPFILAVKGANKHQILDAFEQRITNSYADELATAVHQVLNIMRFRLEERVLG